jgi:hypothetical protein
MAETKNIYMENSTLRRTQRTALKNWFFGSLATLAVTAHTGYAQSTIPQRDLWVIGNNVVKFNGVLPGNISGITTAPIHVQTYTDGTNPNLNSQTINTAYHDENGDLLFYITDSKVYDWEGRFIGSLVDNYSNDISGYKEIAIMPDKCNPRIFYIIAGDRVNVQHQGGGNIQFTKLEIGLDINMISVNGLANANVTAGDVLADGRLGFANDNNVATLLGTAFAMHPMLTINNNTQTFPSFNLSISKKQSDGERLLFINNSFQAAIFTSSEISMAGNNGPTIIPNPIYNTLSGGYNATSESELYQQLGSNVIRLADRNANNGYFYTDYIYSSGAILPSPTTVSLNDPIIPSLFSFFGLEFSSNGRYLFFTASNQPGGLGYFDLNQTTPVAINLSANVNITNFANSQIELGKDGALYFCNGTQLGRLTNANNPTAINSTDFTTINLPNVVLPTGTSFVQFSSNLTDFIYTFNDQVDGEPPYPIATGVGNTLAEAKCCIEHRVYTVDTYTVNGTNHNQTWSNGSNPFNNATGIVSIKNRLVIPAGYSVIINNMIFEYKPFQGDPQNASTFVDGAKCILERSLTNAVNGGQLTLNNTDFRGSNTCYYGMWDGVEVQGDPNAPQQVIGGSPLIVRHQARLLVYNNSIIQDAYYGATNYEFDLVNGGGFIVSNSGPLNSGGIIVAKNATFKNNFIGVDFATYTTANSISNFNTTNFVVDAPLKNPLITPLAMALLLDVKNISFKTCNFKNLVPATYPTVPAVNAIGLHGILALNASFSVFGTSTFLNPAPYNTGCTFENLAYGIRAWNWGLNTVLAQSSIFKNNWRGSYLGNFSGASVTKTQRNTFFVYQLPMGGSALDAAYGQYLDYCNNFIVQENNFHYNTYTGGNVSGTYNSFGLIVNEENPNGDCEKTSNYKGDQVYKNLFKELNIGSQNQGSNSEKPAYATDLSNGCNIFNNTPNNQGLKYVCNTYNGTDDNDITVVPNSQNNKAGRIAYQQGVVSAPAGNVFSHVTPCSAYTPSNVREIYIENSMIGDANPNYINYTHQLAVPTTPYCYSPLAIAPTSIVGNPSTVPNTGNTNTGVGFANACLTKININPVQVNIAQFRALGKVAEQANLPLLAGDAQALITTIATNNSGQIQNALMPPSPYLSDRVLLALINSGVSTGVLKNILLANSPLSEKVKAAYQALGMPHGITNQLNAVQVGISPRAILQAQVTMTKDSQHTYGIEAMYQLLSDTVKIPTDSVITLAAQLGGDEAYCQKIKIYTAGKDTVKAFAMRDTIMAAMGSNIDPICSYLIKLAELDAKYNMGALGIIKDPTAMPKVIAAGGELNAADSRGALGIRLALQKNPYTEWIQALNTGSSARMAQTSNGNEAVKVINNFIKLYPNPSAGMFNYELINTDNAEVAKTIEVYNSMGKLVKHMDIGAADISGTIDLTEFSNGIYFINIISANNVIHNTKINVLK